MANQPGTAFEEVGGPETGEPVSGDLTGTLPSPTIAHVTGNNSTSSFIAANVPCAATAQTVITSASIGTGTWLVHGTVSASVNSVLGTANQEVAIIPHGGSASVAYTSTILEADLAKTESGGALGALITVATLTQIDLVGYAGSTSPWTALAKTSGNSYGNATGLVAVPTV